MWYCPSTQRRKWCQCPRCGSVRDPKPRGQVKFSAKAPRHVKLSRIYAISQAEYCFNFVFKRSFPIHKLFERSCELGLW